MTILTNLLAKMPDMFKKTPTSNLGKLFSIATEQLEKLSNTLNRMQEWRDIELAEGIVLDRIGEEILQEYRGGATDAEYRLKLKTRIVVNYLSNGDIESVIQLLNIFLGNNLVSVQTAANVKEGPFAGLPATLFITIRGHDADYGIPFSELARVMVGGVSTEWEYLLERLLTIEDTSYQTWKYPFEMYAGDLLAGGAKAPNGNAAYTGTEEVSAAYERAVHPYLVASESFFLGNNINAAYAATVEASAVYASKLQTYPICGNYIAGEAY
ncbi:hypothetical protein AWH48_11610 [Domibacillus aminovorans]|uniref:Uncharacterized protein n=1 Tax=Domibacillus aminovorans TaxID=29332 RepID=A0A177KKI4_9BACI|nr:hypothetical protein [Domibacillus aminovorans]OAH53908.1 hypothetical protein AWH48_11610 [Domibacillus aminovorans]